MTVIIAIIAFLLGAIAGAVILWRALPARLRQHVDYRQRWEDAIGLLGNQGQLTQEQVNGLLAGTTRQAASEPVLAPAPVQAATLRTLHAMASWDRKDLEVVRARKGLPPVDDLSGMTSWDQAAVLKARAKAERLQAGDDTA
jgi:hypothetical protein